MKDVVETNNRLMLVGWDAADWKVINPLIEAGRMPNVQCLIENGVKGNLTTLSPVLSPMLWTSIATGKRPYKHGIHGFTEPTADGKSVHPVSILSRKTKALWNILNQNDKRSIVVGWWPSHPAEPLNGVMVSNHYQRAPKTTDTKWPLQEGTIHPATLNEELSELRFHPAELGPEEILEFIPLAAKVDQEKDPRLDSCARVIADATSIQACATHLLETQDWDFAGIYFDAIDHFCHGFMKYHPPQQAGVSDEDFELYQHVVSCGYIFHDMMLGRLMELAGPDTTIMLISDHGFHPDELRPKFMPVEPAGPAIEHRDLGIFAMMGPGVKKDQLVHGAALLDIAPTILNHFGLAVGEDMDGRPLTEVFETEPEIETVPSWDEIAGDDGRHSTDTVERQEVSEQAMEQLVALGYIDRPSDDMGEAVEDSKRELNYNLALSYMDAGMHPKAAEILAELYRKAPLEFRFGVRLAICLQVMRKREQLAEVVHHLSGNWKIASARARARISEFNQKLSQRRSELEDKSADQEESDDDNSPLVYPSEKIALRKLRGIARGNAWTLDYLLSGMAAAEKNHEDAVAYLEDTKASPSETPGYHLQLGHAYLSLQDFAKATEAYNHALELDPEHPSAYLGLARAALAARDPVGAERLARRSLALKYQNPVAHYVLGVAHDRQKRSEKGVASLEKAIELNPNFPEAHKALVKIFDKKLFDPTKAKHHRSMLGEIRKLEKKNYDPIILDLPELSTEDIDAQLPEIKEPDPPTKRRSLSAPADAKLKADGEPVVVVSGFPRSGTSMAMQMLAAGGVQILSDGSREADDNNPKGYLELERVKGLAKDNSWLDEARGQAIKVVSPLLPHLPQAIPYRLIRMIRPASEVAASQRRMLERLGEEGGKFEDSQLIEMIEVQQSQLEQMMLAHGLQVLDLKYTDVHSDPVKAAERIAGFLGADLNTPAMAAVVDPTLWRERS